MSHQHRGLPTTGQQFRAEEHPMRSSLELSREAPRRQDVVAHDINNGKTGSDRQATGCATLALRDPAGAMREPPQR